MLWGTIELSRCSQYVGVKFLCTASLMLHDVRIRKTAFHPWKIGLLTIFNPLIPRYVFGFFLFHVINFTSSLIIAFPILFNFLLPSKFIIIYEIVTWTLITCNRSLTRDLKQTNFALYLLGKEHDQTLIYTVE